MYDSCDSPFVSLLSESRASYTMPTDPRGRSAQFWLYFWHGSISKVEELRHLGCDIGCRHDNDWSLNLAENRAEVGHTPFEILL
jgi:hypothetical protein